EPVARVERDHALAFRVDAAPSRAARHLGQLVVRERAEAAVGALGHALQDDGARRHVDAERHRLGREHDAAEPALEEGLDQALEAGEDARVMRGHPDAQPLEDGLAQRRLADRRVLGHRLADDRVHLAALLARDQRAPVGQHVLHGALTAGAAEDEVDGGQPAARVERLDEHGGIDDAARVPAPAVVLAARLVADDARAARADLRDVVDVTREVGHRVVQRYRAVGMEDRHDRPVHERDPVGDLFDVGDGGREPDQQHVLRRADDDLLPHRAASLVAHVVAFVEHDVAQVVEAAAEQRVAEDLGRHHQHARLSVDLHVTGEDADGVGAVRAREVVELLVGERLERLHGLRAAGILIGGGPAPDGRRVDIFYRLQQPAQVTPAVEEDPYFLAGAWTGYTPSSFTHFVEPWEQVPLVLDGSRVATIV